MIESQELAQLQVYLHTLETSIEELKAKAGAKDMAEFVRQIAALRAKQGARGTNCKDGRAASPSRG